MTDLVRFFRADRFARASGVRLEEVRAGYARARLTVRDRHLNAVDVAQGGAIFTLADLAFAACSNSHGAVAVAVNANIQFVRAGRRGKLVAEAREASVSPRLSSVEVRVTDASGALVALFTGLAYRKKETLAAAAAGRRAGQASARTSSAVPPRAGRGASRARGLRG
ncbi:MAG TPA: PaaI family thioesterase [Anaeromyxobacteraceae bacterium]|nr:PaaI family thioesterase [Anaeromyxobacteraceae bacterium]